MMIRVKEVIMISKTGKRESSVSNKKVLIVSLEPFPFDNKLLMVELTSSVSNANAVLRKHQR